MPHTSLIPTTPLSALATPNERDVGLRSWAGFLEMLPGEVTATPQPSIFLQGGGNLEWFEMAHRGGGMPCGPMGCRLLHDVLVAGHGYVFSGGALAVEDAHLSEVALQWLTAEVERGEHPERLAVSRVSEPVLLVFGPGYPIYGHWLVDFLPRVGLARELFGEDEFRSLRILLPTDAPGWLPVLLEHFFPGAREQILTFDRSTEALACEQVCLPTFPHSGHYFFHSYIRSFYGAYTPVVDGPRRRICVSRRNFEEQTRGALKRLEQREELERRAVEAGYDLLRPEEHSFAEQVAIFAGAEAIVGEFGSGLHNAIFSPPGTVVGAIRMPNAIQSRLGALFGHRAAYVFPEKEWRDERGAETYAVDPDVFEAMLQAIGKALDQPGARRTG